MNPSELLDLVYRIIGELVVTNAALRRQLEGMRNAVQESKADEVPVRPSSGDRAEVGEEVRDEDLPQKEFWE